jgi:hypothetical protein
VLLLDMPPSRATVLEVGGWFSVAWVSFFASVRRMLRGDGGILRLPAYTVAALPDAADNSRGLIYVSDGTSNKRLAVSDGTNWRFPDGNIVS